MEAKICDRCNKYYTKEDHDEACEKASLLLLNKQNDKNAYRDCDFVDLCPECWEKLEEWFRWKK